MTVTKNTKRAKPDPVLIKLADSLLANYQKPADGYRAPVNFEQSLLAA